MDSSKLKAIIVAVLASIAALYLGISAATAQFEAIAWVVGTTVLTTCLLLGRRIWLLLPFLGALNLSFAIAGTPTTMLFGQVLFLGFSLMLLLLRKLPFKLMFSDLEWILLLFALCVLQVYLRNPVGLNIFGDSTVGGRPYLLFVIALFTCVLLCGIRVPPSELRTAMNLSFIGGILNFLIGFTGWLVPGFGVWIGVAGPTGDSNVEEGVMTDTGRSSQHGFMMYIPIVLAKWTCAFMNPIKAALSFKWMPLIFLSLTLAGASGYRNVVASVGLTYLVGLAYRGRLGSVFASGLMGILAVVALALVNSILPLPPNIQRSLSFLPGTWEDRYIRDTENSSDWRFEMWKEALLTDRWIQNKILGDGLGFSAREMEYNLRLKSAKMGDAIGISGLDLQREFVMVNGDYHSGPVSAIRTIGYVGLLVMALAQILTAIRAHQQIVRCRNTEWYPVALFFGIPIIWYPVFFWFIFGAFNQDGTAILMNLGIIRLLENNLPLPCYNALRHSQIPLRLNQEAKRAFT